MTEAIRSWPCGCVSNNERLFPCEAHKGSVGQARNLRADDPRLNVVFAPRKTTLNFQTAQGQPGHFSALLSRDSILKVMNLMGELDETPDSEDEPI